MGKKLTHEEFIKRLVVKNERFANGDFEVLEEYITKRSRLKCRCKVDGYVWYPTADSLLSGRGCPKCGIRIAGDKRRLSHEVFCSKD